MSERALDVLAFVDRAIDPEAPLRINIIGRRHTTRDLRLLNAHERYLTLKLAEMKAHRDILAAAIRYKEAVEGPPVRDEPPQPAPRPIGQHGTTTGYAKGCRCAACRQAVRDYQREYKARKASERSGVVAVEHQIGELSEAT